MKPKLILGIDHGIKSCGAAVIKDYGTHIEIVDVFVRIWNNDPKVQKNRGNSRRARRQLERRSRRQKVLANYLIKCGLLPNNYLDYVSDNSKDIYELRCQAIQGKVDKYDIGRILYKISKSRGYQSNRKINFIENDEKASDNKKETDDKKDSPKLKLEAINELKAKMDNIGVRTYSEYFVTLDTHQERIKTQQLLREYVRNEFELLWQKQTEYYPDVFTSEAYRDISYIIFNQRDLKSQRHKLGRCKFEPSKKKIAKKHFLFQEFRLLQDLNNLKICNIETGEIIDLSQDQRNLLIDHFSEKPKITIIQLLSKLGFKRKTHTVNLVNQTKTELKNIKGLDSLIKLRGALGIELFNEIKANNKLEQLLNLLDHFNNSVELNKILIERWNFSEEVSRNLINLKFEDGYGDLSHKVINKIIPYLREGHRYDEAMKLAGYPHNLYSDKELQKELPAFEQTNYNVINRALAQTRKLINDIAKKYGPFDIIHIESTREDNGKSATDIYAKKSLENEKRNQKAIEYLNEINESTTFRHILKYNLWNEQNGICVLSGKSIPENLLYSPAVEIDHIFPISRSGDDSYMNKSLVYRKENQNKENRTPYEHFYKDSERWKIIKKSTVNLPQAKRERYLCTDFNEYMNEEEKLNNIGWIGKWLGEKLHHICKNVVYVKGYKTGKIRNYLDLNKVLFDKFDLMSEWNVKKRTDHRNHALDALIVAFLSRKRYVDLSNAKYKNEDGRQPEDLLKQLFQNEEPYNFLYDKMRTVITSFDSNKKVSGQMHDEKFYGELSQEEIDYNISNNKLNRNWNQFYKKKIPVVSLTPNAANLLVNPTLREFFTKDIKGMDKEKQKKYLAKYLEGNRFFYSTKVQSVITETELNEMSPSLIKDSYRKLLKVSRYFSISGAVEIRKKCYVKPNSNHHVEIFPNEIRCKKLINCYQLKRECKNVINSKNEPNFLYSLHKNEMVLDISNINLDKIDLTDKSQYNKIFNYIYRVYKIDSKIYLVNNYYDKDRTMTNEMKHKLKKSFRDQHTNPDLENIEYYVNEEYKLWKEEFPKQHKNYLTDISNIELSNFRKIYIDRLGYIHLV